jgi:hypothetical protein
MLFQVVLINYYIFLAHMPTLCRSVESREPLDQIRLNLIDLGYLLRDRRA